MQKATAHMPMKGAAELIDSFRVNVHPAEVASWPARKRKAYEHTVQASEMIAAQFLMALQGREEELADVLTPRPKGATLVRNLYAERRGRGEIVALVNAIYDRNGNAPPMPGVWPDYAAPVVVNGECGRGIRDMRWGMLSPPAARAD